ncbi:hypothetical protein HY26_08335 [Hyphomonas sp. GM-8P]|nr:hypothetical protein HY26_08335 [Hyphomonas sp. GM-8P]
MFDEIIEPSLPKRVRRFPLPFWKRICPSQPVENKLTKRLKREADISLDFTLTDFKGIQARQNAFLEPSFDLRIKVLSKRLAAFVAPGLGVALSSLA